MPLTDRFGLPLTTQSARAAESYGRAVDLLLSANAGGEALLDAALMADPEFALAHIARARLCQMQTRMPEAKEAAARARGLADRLSAREQGTIEVIALTVDGRAAGDGPPRSARRRLPARRAGLVIGARRVRIVGVQRPARPSRGAAGIAGTARAAMG